jgi:hypothetical protein
MTRKCTVFDPVVMNRVRILLAMGKNGTQIASELEVDADSLRAACNRYGIRLREMKPRDVSDSLALKIELAADVSDLLRKEARIRGFSCRELAAEIISAVVGDSLFSAVLDK